MPKPVVNAEKCNLCGTCIEICPMNVFVKGKKHAEVANDECIGCRACEAQCSQHAIVIEE